MDAEGLLREVATVPPAPRVDFWCRFIDASGTRKMAEIGVFSGRFAASILRRCDHLTRYYMIDPWHKLESWNMPANVSDERFAQLFSEAMGRTSQWQDKRIVLRGKTTEVIEQIPDQELDLVYVDGDHTLRGIAIDLISCYRKTKVDGWIGGDDFCASIQQHDQRFEPTLVFPFAVYFAEAVNERIFALPRNQFLIDKHPDRGFEFCDLTGDYIATDLRSQIDLVARDAQEPQQ